MTDKHMKSCPFCKSTVTLVPFSKGFVKIICEKGSLCDGSGLVMIINKDLMDKSIEVWNTR